MLSRLPMVPSLMAWVESPAMIGPVTAKLEAVMVSWPSFSARDILPMRVSIRLTESATLRFLLDPCDPRKARCLIMARSFFLEKLTHDTRTTGRQSQPFARSGRDCPVGPGAANRNGEPRAMDRSGAQRAAAARPRAVPGHRGHGLWTDSPQQLEPAVL